MDERQVLQATRAHWTLEAFRLAHTVPWIVSRVDALRRGSERPAPRGVLPGVGREFGCVTLPDIYICAYRPLEKHMEERRVPRGDDRGPDPGAEV